MVLPEGKPGKALALGIGAVGLLLIYAAIIRPIIGGYHDLQDGLSGLNAQRDRLIALEADLPALQAQAADLRSRKQTEEGRFLLPATSDSVAAASLQTKVQSLGKSRGAEVSSVESLAPRVQDGFRRIAVRVVVSCDLRALTGILSALASAQPALYVENLEVRANSDLGAKSSDAAPILNVSMDVYGYRADDAKPAGGRG
jgi:general secretion pathway protein M